MRIVQEDSVKKIEDTLLSQRSAYQMNDGIARQVPFGLDKASKGLQLDVSTYTEVTISGRHCRWRCQETPVLSFIDLIR